MSKCVALGFAALLFLLFYFPFLDKAELAHEEPRRVQVAINMQDSGNYLVGSINGKPYVAKPPLYNWAILLTSLPFGEISEKSARLTSPLSLLILCFALFFLFRHQLGTYELLFLLGGLFLTPQLAAKVQLAEIEILFTGLVTLNLWVWFHLYQKGHRGLWLWLAPSILAGLSYLTKREPALLFYYLPVFAYLFYRRDFKILFSPAHIFGAFLVILISSVWLYPAIQSVGFEYFLGNMQEEVVTRGGAEGLLPYAKHLLLYPLNVWLGALPFALPLILLLHKPIYKKLISHHKEVFVFASLAILVNLPVYLIKPGIAVRYLMPMLPTLLILCTFILKEAFATEQITPILARHLRKFLISLTGLVLLVLVTRALLTSGTITAPNLERFGEPWIPQFWFALLVMAMSIDFLFLIKPPGFIREVFPYKAIVVFSFLLLGLSIRVVQLQIIHPQKAYRVAQVELTTPWMQTMNKEVRSLNSGDKNVYVVTHIEPKIWFYDKNRHFVMTPVEDLVEKAKANPNDDFLMFLHDGGLDRLEPLEALSSDLGFQLEEVFSMPHRVNTYVLYKLSPTNK